MNKLLSIGRAIGPENFAQMKGAIRAVTSDGPAQYVGRLEFKNKDAYEFVENLDVPAQVKQSVKDGWAAMRMALPEEMGEGVDNIIDFVVKKFGGQSGSLKMNHVIKNGDEVIGETATSIAKNASGTKLKMQGSGKNRGGKLDMVLMPERGYDDPISTMVKTVDGIDYKEVDGMGKVSVNLEDIGLIRKLDMVSEAPTTYWDTYAKQSLQADSFKGFVQSTKEEVEKMVRDFD